VRITVFSDSAQTELLRLQDGDAIAVQGRLSAETYISATDGKTNISLNIVAGPVLALRQPPKKREAKAKPSPSAQAERAFDDALPF